VLVWCRYKGSRELPESDKYTMTKDGDTYVLVVNDVFGEDADEYCVKATTAAGSRASRADLVIKSQCQHSGRDYCRPPSSADILVLTCAL